MKISCNHHIESFTQGDVTDHIQTQLPKLPLNLPNNEYNFSYSYPLDRPCTISHSLSQSTTVADIMALAANDYRSIYATEEEYLLLDIKERPHPNSPFGIWGHDLNDLYFGQIIIDIDHLNVKFLISS